MTHLLDTTALLALVLRESGSEQVQALFEDDRTSAVVSVLTKAEIWARLKSLGREADFEDEWKILLSLFDAVLPVDEKVVDQSIALRRTSPERLPTIDALIAATAANHGLVLVHRDAHMRTIPHTDLTQLDLAAGSNV
jgi:predicted nucleic acid-binding protein